MQWRPRGSTIFTSVLTTKRCTSFSTWHSNYIFGAMCRSRQVDPFHRIVHIVRGGHSALCTVMPALILPKRLCRRLLLPLALPTTNTLGALCLIYPNFFAVVDLYHGTAVLSTLKYDFVIVCTSIITNHTFHWGLKNLRSQFLSLL